ncbi:phosphate ABC transporter permease PstA [Streptomyces polyrhachis]|uniref:Phosphate transport system permease protein PstA n=1 Tax=Streptomyces polyrhachis TaxID=1282885 RepID=A0ABW2GL79_9ACTN
MPETLTDQTPPGTAPSGTAHPNGAAPDGSRAKVTTIVVRPARPAGEEPRRSTATVHREDVLALLGALAAALSLTWLVFARIAPFDAPLGFTAVAYTLFVLAYGALVSFDNNRVTVRDRIAAVVWHSLALLLLAALAFVILYALWRGHRALGHLNFLTQDLSSAGPQDPLTRGGMLHAVVGTLEQIGLALAVTIPLGIACAVFLNEMPGRYARFVRTIVEAMTALPSIVAGLFVYAVIIFTLKQHQAGNLFFHLDKSGFAAALALSVMMLPIIIRASDVVIRLVPGSLREASLALGASQWRTVWTVVLPTARSGLTTAVILGAARGIGETSPVLLTAGYAAGLNADPFSGPQVSLPLATFELVRSPQPDAIARGFGAAALLLALVLVLFVVARLIGGRAPGHLSRGQRRRRARRSYRDARRIAGRARARTAADPPPAPTGGDG